MNVIRRLWVFLERLTIEHAPVFVPKRRVLFGDLSRGLSGALGGEFHLVFALVAIRNEVSDVGDVHNVGDFEAFAAQETLEQVRHQLRAQVANVGRPVNRWTTGVDPNATRLDRLEFRFLSSSGVIEDDLTHLCCSSFG